MTERGQTRERVPESEKITINLGYVDLGRIDLLVQEGFYSNRTDFIRTAIRNQLGTHAEEVSRSLERKTLELGLRDIGVADLEAARSAGEKLHLRVVGLLRIAPGVAPDLARATIGSTMEGEHDPVFGELEFEADLVARTGRFAVDGKEMLKIEPILNPVTGKPHRARIVLPEGFEFHEAEMGSGNIVAEGPIPMAHDKSYAALWYAAYGPYGLIENAA